LTNVVCDLDGVVYLGDQVIPGVAEALERLGQAGARPLLVTNNAFLTPSQVAAKIERLTGWVAGPDDVCTSPQAAVGMLGPGDTPVLVVGEEGITSVLEAQGLTATDDPALAGSVMVGLTPRITYDWIAAGAEAVRRGARFIATNVDSTYPTPKGLLPGAGSIVAAIAAASGVQPEIAGKPHRPMRDLIKARVTGPVWVVGDRVDTDIALAEGEPDWTTVLVLSGVTDSGRAGVDADHVTADLAGAVDLILSGPTR
jgi:HAD superfamily hydrolase (TIGR01450 family)